MFEVSIVCSVLIIHFIKQVTTFSFKPEWFMRLSGLMLDMLVIAALSSALPRPERVEQVDYSLVSVYVIACAAWNVFAFIFLAKSMFPNFWYERGVTLTGNRFFDYSVFNFISKTIFDLVLL
jgi:Na+/glutamate symporter